MKAFSLLFIIVSSSLYHPTVKRDNIAILQKDTLLTTLIRDKKAADQFEYQHRKDQIKFVKKTGKKMPFKVKGEYVPDNAEYTYTVVKSQTGEVISITQSPVSESGDWYIGYKHYIDTNGNVYAFTKTETLFDDNVKGGMAMKLLTIYYNSEHQVISRSLILADRDAKPLKGKKFADFDFRDDKFKIYGTINECLAAYHIKLDD